MARRIYQISKKGIMLKAINVEFESPINPGEILNPAAVFYNGKNLWFAASRPTESWVFLLTMDGKKIRTVNFSAVDLLPQSILDISRNILVTGEEHDLTYQFDYNFNLIRTINMGASPPSEGSLSYDSKSLLWEGEFPPRIKYKDFDGITLKSIDISGIDSLGGSISFDGAYVWFFGGAAVKIYKITGGGSPVVGIDLSSILSSANSLSFNGRDFFIATADGVV